MHQLQKAIGILGGTFDPIHNGHLRLALESYETLGLAKIHLVPCFQPVHRDLPIATPDERFAMVLSAIANEPALYADAREIKRKGPSYAIDTLEEMRREMPHTPLCYLMGIDAFSGLHTWHRYEAILEVAHIIVAKRPTFELTDTSPIASLFKTRLCHKIDYIHQHLAGGILLLPITPLEISASEIRKLIAMRRNPRYLLPDSVYDYIQQHGTYIK